MSLDTHDRHDQPFVGFLKVFFVSAIDSFNVAKNLALSTVPFGEPVSLGLIVQSYTQRSVNLQNQGRGFKSFLARTWLKGPQWSQGYKYLRATASIPINSL